MIQIGATTTPALLGLLKEAHIPFDYVKFDSDGGLALLQELLCYRPVLLHDVANHVWLNYADPFDAATMTTAHQLLQAAQPPWFSTGIGASAEPQGHTTPFWRGAAPEALQSRAVVTANIIRNGRRLQEWLGGVPLLLENYNYHPTHAYEYVCEPETFCALIEAIGCGVLLDLAHAQISAHNMGWPDVRSYLQALPLARVREIHTNHPQIDPTLGQMIDRHLPIQPADLELLHWTLAHTPAVEAITLESESPDETTLLNEIALLRSVVDGASGAGA
jgi:uncharacterized protein (UPF0276 family)